VRRRSDRAACIARMRNEGASGHDAWRFSGASSIRNIGRIAAIYGNHQSFARARIVAGLAQLLAQARHGRLGRAAQKAPRLGGALPAPCSGEDSAAQFLRRPGKEELGLDSPLEERSDRLARFATSPPSLRSSRCSRSTLRSAASSPRGQSVEDDESRHVLRPDLGSTSLGHRDLPPNPASPRRTTWRSSEASSASSERRLERCDQPCGRS